MASPTRATERIRKAKRVAAGKNRKRDIAREHRISSEKQLEIALGEKISLPTTR